MKIKKLKMISNVKKAPSSGRLLKGSYQVMPRSSAIMPDQIGSTLKVHNGKLYVKLKITKDMVGKKAGEFVVTKKKFSFKKKK